jgi:hypothetical protein
VTGFVGELRDRITEKFNDCDPMHIKLTVDNKEALQEISFLLEKNSDIVYYLSLQLSEHNSVKLDTNEIKAFIDTAKKNADK